MKLIIQVPCFNEEHTLPHTIKEFPKNIDGIDVIEYLVINDGSLDKTYLTAKELGVHHIINFKHNRGLAKAFETGIEYALQHGADLIVNTDGDNQYSGKDIEKLVKPIIEGEADVVIGDRDTNKIEHFSWSKKALQRFGSAVVRRFSKTNIPDAVSGFRAYSREAATNINVYSKFSYTIENLIQLGTENFKIVSIKVNTNEKLRKSRLFKGNISFISRQLTTLIRSYAAYKPLRVFSFVGIILIIPGILGFFRFLYFYFADGGEGHVQSLIFSSAALMIGIIMFAIGILSELISNNRKLLEKILYILKSEKWDKK